MAIFQSDVEAFIYILVLSVVFFALNKVLSIVLYNSERFSQEQKNKALFGFRLGAIIIIVFLLIEGFPSFEKIDPTYSLVLTGAISTALAFATSEIFASFIAGILLIIVDPFDIGDVVKIKGHKGIIRSMTLTKVVIETFDNVIIEISNLKVVTSILLNYTINLKSTGSFYRFKKQVEAPQDIGNSRLDIDIEEYNEAQDEELKELFETVKTREIEKIHSYTFKQQFPYKQLRIKIDQVDKVCAEYKEIFGFKPRFHIIAVGYAIDIKFRIITLDSSRLLDGLPSFTKEICKIVKK